MNRLNLLFFALLISYMHNFYSEFNTIFLQSFLFLFLSELISIKLINRFRNQQNQQNKTNQDDDDDSSVSESEEEKTEDKTEEKTEDKTEEKTEEKTEDKTEKKTEDKTEETRVTTEKKESSEETPEESDSDETGGSDEPVDITDGVDVSQIEILRLLNNYESLGDSGLMELKNKMLELDKLVEFYKNDTKKTQKG